MLILKILMRSHIGLLLCSLGLMAGESESSPLAVKRSLPFALKALVQPQSNNNVSKKSPWMAVSLSAVAPGAGQLYVQNGNESLIKGITFLAAEAAGLIVYFHYKREGERFERKFERYADQNWDVDKYLIFLEHSLSLQEGYLGRKDTGIEKGRLELAENDWGAVSGVSVHHLYKNTRQQYYEMIFKYPEQFALGWSDAVDNAGVYPHTGYSRNNLTPMMVSYRGMRVKSNDYLSAARGVTGVIMINHILSMADAAWSVKKRNSADDLRKVTLALRIEQNFYYNTLMTMPTLRLTY